MKRSLPTAFYSDFNCPYCYSLNERLRTIGDIQSVEWRGIQHMPAASSVVRTIDVQSELLGEVAVIRKRAREIAIVTPDFRPSTALANDVVCALRDEEPAKVAGLRTLIYRSYWQEGRDFSDPEILRELVELAGLEYPDSIEDPDGTRLLEEWQAEWEGERYNHRLPVLLSTELDEPLLGFPTYEVLYKFFTGEGLPLLPENLAACRMKERLIVLEIGRFDVTPCNSVELQGPYAVHRVPSVEDARSWQAARSCPADLLVLDHASLGESAIEYCQERRALSPLRHTSVVFLLAEQDVDVELAAFDAGASDVVYDLSHRKVCQARLDGHLRTLSSRSLIEALVRLDYLTELPNRREYERRLEEEWLRGRRTGSPLSLILVDIDHFKPYNDHHGHTTGDDCLRAVAQAVGGCIRRVSDLVARYGGEELVAVLPNTPLEGAIQIAESMRRAVADAELRHAASPVAPFVTISAGVACLTPGPEQLPSELVVRADAALYRAKDEGRNRVVPRAADLERG